MEISLEIFFLIYFNKIRFELSPVQIFYQKIRNMKLLSPIYLKTFQHYLKEKPQLSIFVWGEFYLYIPNLYFSME